MLDEGSDDEDGDIRPPPHALLACGGGIRTINHIGCRDAVPIELWSSEKDPNNGVGFACALDVYTCMFYAKLQWMADGVNSAAKVSTAEMAMKGAIMALLDVAEACNSKTITLGLSAEHARCAELVRSLLFLGFQVVPSRKSPLVNTALLLEYDINVDSPAASDGEDWCAGASDCSTSAESAEDDDPFDTDPEDD
mmetsp:Transcript_75567/g.161951  ORF Transcript_75567/g.161951 Transcript_75567/m.161951 type:complete len:195 (+) Transcript_75567:196-780(+)